MKKSGLKVAVVLGGAILLAACSGSSSNISDPPPETDPSASCGSGQTCITGRFEDGQVTGLDYTCGAITAKTDSNGDFTCAVGSTIKFMIKHPDSVHEVLLGQALVQDALKDTRLLPVGTDGKPLKRIYLTALDLAGTKDIAVPEAVTARNITRLLHALNSSSNSSSLAIKDNPARDIVLTEADKKEFLVALNESISLAAVSEDDFEAKVSPALSSMTVPRIMISRPDADRTLEKATYSIMAGLYQDNGFIISTTTPVNTGLGVLTSFFYGFNASEELFGEVLLGVDRKGRFFGAGSASMGARDTEIELVRYDPTRFYPRSGRYLKLDGSVAGLEFDLDNLQSFSMASGVIDRNFMAINETAYKNAYGVDVPSSDKLGTLASPSPVSPYTFSGVNLLRPTNLVTTLNPDVWNELTFPIHVKATLKKKINTIESVVGTANFTILSDGNIVTDLDADCSAVDLDSLSDGDKQEQPMGVVGRVFPIDSRLYIEPLLVMPKTVEFGSAIANSSVGGLGNPVRLRVDFGSNYLKSFKNTAGVTTDDEVASWVNKYVFFKNIHDGNEGSAISDGVEGDFVTEPASCPIVP